MNNFTKIFFVIFTMSLFSFSISVKGKKIDIHNFDSYKLEKIVLRKVNKLRKKHKKTKLKKDATLRIAAQDHANYLIVRKKLTHSQKNKAKKSPMKRVEFYKGKFTIVGENIASTYIFKPVVSPEDNETVILETYTELGEHIFQLWKNSKEHYKNMLDDSYNFSGISFALNTRDKRVCSSQVFGFKKN